MVSYIFGNILNSPDIPQRQREARQWFRDQASEIRRNEAAPQKIITGNRTALTNILLPGRMYSFKYTDPKYKKKLPYYDAFPLIFVVKNDMNSFLGLNLHYLPPELRAKLMDALYMRVVSEESNDIQTRVRISYNILRSTSSLKLYKPCLRRYLYSHVTSRFLYINPDKWDIALMLPSARSQKAGINKVHKDSRRMVTRRR